MPITTTSIETVSGLFVDFADPSPASIQISDIAWALAREPRFGGHTIHELPYSVAQHSVNVLHLVEAAMDRSKSNPMRSHLIDWINSKNPARAELVASLRPNDVQLLLAALLHDASEAYLRDLPAPAKEMPGMREAYGALEAKLMSVILTKLAPAPKNVETLEAIQLVVRWADIYALSQEAYMLLPSRGLQWPWVFKMSQSEVASLNVKPQTFYEARDSFLSEFRRIYKLHLQQQRAS